MEEKLKSKKLALFFTYGVSLELWEKKGMLARELKLYQELGKYFGRIYLITYGRNDRRFQAELSKYNLEVLPQKTRLPDAIYSLLLAFYYRRELKQCDFYKTNQMLGSWSAVLAKWLYRKKLLVRTGYTLSIFSKKINKIKYLFAKVIEWLALKNCDLFIVATRQEKEYFKNHQEKIKVIPNFVDTDLFRPLPELKNKEGKTILLFIGRLNEQKNLENLILSLESLNNVKLHIIGSGDLECKLKKMASEKKVGVEFLGNVPHKELPRFINYADIFVLPSLYEGNPKVLLEAMACGLPVLATEVVGIKNIIKHQDNGYLVKITAQSLQYGIGDLIKNKELLTSLGQKARESILQNNSLDKIIVLELANYV